MMNRPTPSPDEGPFVRTLVGHAGLPGSQVVTARSGSIFTVGDRIGLSGNVYEVASSEHAVPVVIKLFIDAVGADAAELESFSREPLQASQLSHPNIVRVLESGVLENGVPFVVMEKLSGETLKEWLRHHGSLSTAMLRDIIRGVASALAAAHATGIVHGAVRPDSIFIESHREGGGARVHATLVKLLDFGARSLTPLTRSADGDTNRSESAPFLAPEQTDGGRSTLDARTDQFGLAATARAALAYAPSRPSPAIDAVLRMACCRRPEDRFESIGRFVTALDEASAGAALISGKVDRSPPPSDLEVTPIGPMEVPVAAMRKRPSRSITGPSNYGRVTKEFFEQGERMSEEAATAEVPPDLSESSLRIPVRRGRNWVAGIFGVALAGLLGFGLSRVWQPLNNISANARQLFSNTRPAEPTSAPSTTPAPAAQALIPEPTANSAPAAATTPAATVAAPPAPAATPAPAPTPAPAATPPPAPAVPAEAPPAAPRPSRAHELEEANPRPAPAPAARVRVAASPTADSVRNGPRDPLRGYVWSPRERRLVPAYRAMSPGDSLGSPSADISAPASSGSEQWAVPPPPPMPSLTPPPPSIPSPTEPPALAPPPLPDPIPAPRP